MKNRLILVFILLPFASIFAQEVNLIPNSGFEEYAGFPLGWNYSGKDFDRILKYWESPTSASPDVYGPEVVVPRMWKEKGFGDKHPYEGSSMVGITLYGCEHGKPHCREYLEVELYEPLIPGQRYKLDCMVSHLPCSLQIDRIGFLFLGQRLDLSIDSRISMSPHLETVDLIKSRQNTWTNVSFEFVADERANYLIIGNFQEDDQTKTHQCSAESLPFAYYYFDDLSLVKLPPILEQPIDENDLRLQTLEEGKVIQLHNIYFAFDMDELSPRSYVELYQLLEILNANPGMEIEILGHTDELGTDNYNKDLSDRRANAVVEFLASNGINNNRLSAKGFGSSKPVASNADSSGRQLNRRVEFKILSMARDQ